MKPSSRACSSAAVLKGRSRVDRVSPDLDSDIELAHCMADVAGQIALSYFNATVEQWDKPDGTTVSRADLAVEAALLKVLAKERPHDAVLSEEAGVSGVSSRRWILDPIDGTTPFLAGEPRWGTHIALESNGDLIVGVITRPARGLRWWAARGQGAYLTAATDPHSRDKRLRVSGNSSLASARVTAFAWPESSAPHDLAMHGQWVPFEDELCVVGAVAEGRLDAFIQEAGGVWDHAPQVLVVTEAGGGFRDAHGGARYDLGPGLYTNGLLEPAVLEATAGSWPPPPRTQKGAANA